MEGRVAVLASLAPAMGTAENVHLEALAVFFITSTLLAGAALGVNFFPDHGRVDSSLCKSKCACNPGLEGIRVTLFDSFHSLSS